MFNVTKLLSGVKVLKEVNSKFNGDLVVKKDLAWGTYIQADGVTQSGGVVETIWKSVLKRVLSRKYQVTSVLILGLGGGTIAKLTRKNWPKAKITGVDIDPIMVELGDKYMHLGDLHVEIVVEDGYKYCLKLKAKGKEYDLICIDLYHGDGFPKKFEEEKFLRIVKKLLKKDGVAIFNRLYGEGKRGDAMRFLKKLEKVFSQVDPFYPEANMIYICTLNPEQILHFSP